MSANSMSVDLILKKGRITTLDSRCPFISALAIAEGRFIATVDDKDWVGLYCLVAGKTVGGARIYP